MTTSDPGRVSQEHEIVSNTFLKSASDLATKSRGRISTGSKSFDDLLSGGLERGKITQIYGAPYTGKTHLCHLLSVVLPSPFQAVYIDTERSFRNERIESIANARGLGCRNILPRIHIAQPQDSKKQESCIEEVCSTVRSDPTIKLLIVDSFTSHYRSDYPERSQLSERASRLNKYMNVLSTLAKTSNIAVIITNQTASFQQADFQLNEPKPFGGNIVSYSSSYIIRLERCKRSAVEAILVKSPLQGYRTYHLTVFEGGFLHMTQYFD